MSESIPNLVYPTLPPPGKIVNRKYRRGKIYIIKSPNHNKAYIGSTCQKLEYRLAFHNETRNTTCTEILDAGDAYITLLEAFPCSTKEELLRKEGEYIREYKDAIVNHNIAGRTKYEYHAEVFSEYNKSRCKDYYENTKQKITCICGKEILNKGLKSHLLTKYHLEHTKDL